MPAGRLAGMPFARVPLPTVTSAPGRRPRERAARAWRALLCALLLATLGGAWAEGFAVPAFPSRDGVPTAVADAFTAALRAALADQGVRVTEAPLVTAGIAGSLEPAFGELVARLEGTRYAVLGEYLLRDAPDGPFALDLVVVDAVGGRSSDLVSRAFGLATVEAVAGDVADVLLAFTVPEPTLPAGDAGLFVSSNPSGAEVRVDGVVVGVTGSLDLLGLAPGRYEVEVRRAGYLPEVRSLELRAQDTRFLHVVLTEVVGGSLQVLAWPTAEVWIDGVYAGTTPATLTSRLGEVEVELRRAGFASRVTTVPVRAFRVTRLERTLEPLGEPLIVWPAAERLRVLVDGRLQTEGYALPGAGLRTIEVLQGGEVRRWTRAVPDAGVYELDLDTGELVPLVP